MNAHDDFRDHGYVLLRPTLEPAAMTALVDVAETLRWTPNAASVGAVRQCKHEAILTGAAAHRLRTTVDAIRVVVSDAIGRDWNPDEQTMNRYRDGEGFVSGHRDHRRYVTAVAVLTVHGSARFEILESRTGPALWSHVTTAGELVVMAATTAPTDRRPFHRVNPPTSGTRLSLTLRCTAEGSN